MAHYFKFGEMERQMRHKIIFAICFCLSFFITIESGLPQVIPSDIKKIVTFIFLADEQGNLKLDAQGHPAAYGTGFFVSVKNESGNGIYGYLVTAKHVLHDEHGGALQRVFVRLNRKDGGFQFVPIDLFQSGKSVVCTDADDTVDIAVIPAFPSEKFIDFKILPDDLISTKDTFEKFNVSEGTDVFFVGLFATYYGDHRNNPIVRFGRVSMFPEDRIDWGNPPRKTEIYLIEAQSYGGNSGSPVFFNLGSDRFKNGGVVLGAAPLIMLAGVMSGRFNDTGAPVAYIQSPTTVTPVLLPNLGIAAVSPAYLLHRILFSDELKKLRADHPIIATPPSDTPQPPGDSPSTTPSK